MTRSIVIVLLLLLINSCKTAEKKEVIDELLVFGHSGFCIKDSSNQIYPPEQIWKNNSIIPDLEFDSTHLDIRKYFEFERDSIIRVARRQYMHQMEFLSINKKDTIGLESILNKILLFRNPKHEYFSKEMYKYSDNEWSYTIYYKTSNHKEFLIHYEPDQLPDSLRVLHNFIYKIIVSKALPISGKFDFNKITTKEAKKLFKKNPPPPLPSTVNFKVKFVEPHKNKSIEK